MAQPLDDLIRQPVDDGTLPHAYAAVVKDGNVVYEGQAGDAARDRIYRLASMTKPVTESSHEAMPNRQQQLKFSGFSPAGEHLVASCRLEAMLRGLAATRISVWNAAELIAIGIPTTTCIPI